MGCYTIGRLAPGCNQEPAFAHGALAGRRIGVVAIAVTIANATVGSVNEELKAFTLSYLPTRFNGFGLSTVQGTGTNAVFPHNCPILTTRNNMWITRHRRYLLSQNQPPVSSAAISIEANRPQVDGYMTLPVDPK
jgi:hypothetical protein